MSVQNQTQVSQGHNFASPQVVGVGLIHVLLKRRESNLADHLGNGELVWTRRLLGWLAPTCWLLACLVAVSAPTKEALVKRDLAELQGEWRAVAGERDGQLRPKAFLEALQVCVKDDVMTMTLGKRQQRLRLVLNPSVRPKTVDLVHLEGREKDEVWSGIYVLEGPRWKLCMAPPGQERPKDFFTRPGLGWELLILERKSALPASDK
ncbi:MAG: TIGR03067 domain-containing protein [Gemmatales bacterium]|nr:TIGR03067 domain-containing protein [Gemmatales bacterium]MDW7995026.1 TIGR03067 domain-containing protein [Gemmatales bacterium]